MKVNIIGFCILLFSYTPLLAQFSDSLRISIETTATIAREDYQPFWISSLQFGTISPQKTDLATHFLVTNVHYFSRNQAQDEKNKGPKTNNFYIRYGIDLYHNDHFQEIFTKEAFLKAGYKSWELRAGQFMDIIGEVDPQLSSGSFAVSGNALPIPKIGLAVTDYTEVPFTNGFLQFKGLFSHGWLGNNNYVKGANLHEKNLYLRGGRKAFRIYGGLSHFANWGGIHPNGKTPSRFKDFIRIIGGASGDAEDPVYQQGPIDIANAVGNHMLISDIGMELKIKKSKIRLYTQTIFEKGRGDSSNTNIRDELVGLNIFGKDRLLGIFWETQEKLWVQKILIEGIYTKDQGGDIIFNGRYNYYNNATYATGWEYKNNIIGTPLFVSRSQAAYYNLDPSSTRGWNIVSNRIMGFHTGIKGNISEKIIYRTVITYIRHYGNYYNDDVFNPPKNQGNFLFELNYRLNPNIFLSSAIALDSGDLSKNKGAKLGVEWSIK